MKDRLKTIKQSNSVDYNINVPEMVVYTMKERNLSFLENHISWRMIKRTLSILQLKSRYIQNRRRRRHHSWYGIV